MMCTGKTHKYNSYRAYCGPCGQWLIGNNSLTDPVAIPGSTPTQRSAASGSRSLKKPESNNSAVSTYRTSDECEHECKF